MCVAGRRLVEAEVEGNARLGKPVAAVNELARRELLSLVVGLDDVEAVPVDAVCDAGAGSVVPVLTIVDVGRILACLRRRWRRATGIVPGHPTIRMDDGVDCAAHENHARVVLPRAPKERLDAGEALVGSRRIGDAAVTNPELPPCSSRPCAVITSCCFGFAGRRG